MYVHRITIALNAYRVLLGTPYYDKFSIHTSTLIRLGFLKQDTAQAQTKVLTGRM